LRPSSPTSNRWRRSTSRNDPAQYSLPFLLESVTPLGVGKPDCGDTGEPGETPASKTQIVTESSAATERTHPPSGRRTESKRQRPRQPVAKHLVPAAKKPPITHGRVDMMSASANIISLIETRSGAWSAPELAELLGCTGKHIYALAKSGRMPHIRIGGMVRFDPAATADWLRNRFVAA
jgi:excisionase family DNA binding protein